MADWIKPDSHINNGFGNPPYAYDDVIVTWASGHTNADMQLYVSGKYVYNCSKVKVLFEGHEIGMSDSPNGGIRVYVYYGGGWHDLGYCAFGHEHVDITFEPSISPPQTVEKMQIVALGTDSNDVARILETWFYGDSYIDIGLRVFDGTNTVAIAAWPLGEESKSPLRIAADTDNNGTPEVYGIVLVDPGDSMDSGVRIQTSAGIKALGKL